MIETRQLLADARDRFEQHVDRVDKATKWFHIVRVPEGGSVVKKVNTQTQPDAQFNRASALLSRLLAVEQTYATLIDDLDDYGLF
jgi:hypothetical protein